MYFTRILLSIVFVLFASTALAKKPAKILVCHVGNELGSMGETYMDNPDCTIPPEWVGDPVDYMCPDAGKIDLILVSQKAIHIGNESHSFDGDSDYAPVLADVGDDPADFEDNSTPLDGIDDGCEEYLNLQILAINDYHGHLKENTPGTINGNPAGGSEFLSAKLNELRDGQTYSLTVAAGDLIGGSPQFSGLFHDEPSVESLNAMEIDISSVGNPEFDEGVTELLRMQFGGCHPVDGCYFPEMPYTGAEFLWLAANVVNDAGETPLPPYWIERVKGVNVGFIGMTLEATDTLVAAAGIQGWYFLDEVEVANLLVPVLKAQGVKAIVVLLHEGGSQTPPPGEVDACVGISGPVVAINDALDPEIDVMITGHTHLPYNCKLPDADGNPRIVTSAYSFGRVVTEVNLVLDKKTRDVDRDLSTATNHSVIQADLTADPVLTAIIEKWQPLYDAAGGTPIGTITEDITRGGNPPGSDRGVCGGQPGRRRATMGVIVQRRGNRVHEPWWGAFRPDVSPVSL
jgi:hypothetical protein